MIPPRALAPIYCPLVSASDYFPFIFLIFFSRFPKRKSKNYISYYTYFACSKRLNVCYVMSCIAIVLKIVCPPGCLPDRITFTCLYQYIDGTVLTDYNAHIAYTDDLCLFCYNLATVKPHLFQHSFRFNLKYVTSALERTKKKKRKKEKNKKKNDWEKWSRGEKRLQ